MLVGVLAPLSPPGWVAAGTQLVTGLSLAAEQVNDAGGIHGRGLELIVRDTAADPEAAVRAVDELAAQGVVALAGEYHSVVARAAAARATALEVPLLCSSAVIDALVEQPTDWVARIAPAQSHGWRIYADFLSDAGLRHVALVTQPSAYWAAGTRILRDHLEPRGVELTEYAADLGPADLCHALAGSRCEALLLLVGHPEPAASIVRAVLADRRLTGLVLGAPAGQPELDDWLTPEEVDLTPVPFLSYLPQHLSALGARVGTALAERLGTRPSFVAFEGFDTILTLAEMLRDHGTDRRGLADAWPLVSVAGTRGLIRFARADGVWQWQWPPVQVVERDPAATNGFRTLRARE